MNNILPIAAAISIFIMMVLLLVVLIYAGVELWKMQEKTPAVVFFIMAIVWVAVIAMIIAVAAERGL